MSDLHIRLRPKSLKFVRGQPDAVKKLEAWLAKKKVPKAILFVGPSGCGKTTLARILAEQMGCEMKGHYKEVNAAESRGIDTVRDLEAQSHLSPMVGTSRVYVLDEAHKLTNDAQNALLKPLEDEKYPHAYWWLCTTEPRKLLETIDTRCTKIKVVPVEDSALIELVTTSYGRVKKGDVLAEDVAQAIVEQSLGSARRAMVLLGSVIDLPPEDRLDAVMKADVKENAFNLVKALLPFDRRVEVTLKGVMDVLATIPDENPEGLRRMILATCTSHLLKCNGMEHKAATVMNCFRDPFFDEGSARQMLTLCCYEAVQSLRSST